MTHVIIAILGCIPAIEMAVHDINNRPDILPGYKLHIEIKDTKVFQYNKFSLITYFLATRPIVHYIMQGLQFHNVVFVTFSYKNYFDN